jgi:phage terminase large subunit
MAQPQTSPQSIDPLKVKLIQQTLAEPVWFAREVLNHKVLEGEPTLSQDAGASWELDQFQCDVLEAIADIWRKKKGIPTRINHEGKNFITVRSGHGPGKTHLAALVAHWMNSAFPARTVCTAPKLAQLRTRLWASIRKIDARAAPWYRSTHIVHDTAVYWYGPDGQEDKNWCILAETASHPENLAGHHERFQLVIVEEATGVPETLYPVIFGALSTGTIQVLLMISNPTKQTGSFAFSHLKASEADNYFRYHINLKNAKRINRDWAEKLARKYGSNSPVYKIRVLGEFADSSPMQLIPTAWVMAAIDRPARGSDGSVRRVRVTVDVADGGENETVVMAKEIWGTHDVVLRFKRYSFEAKDAIALAGDAAIKMFDDIHGKKGTDDFVVDSLGVGAGCRDHIIRKGHSVVEYKGGATSDDMDQWRNRRVQSYICLRDMFRDDKVDFADDCFESVEDMDEYLAQMATVEKTDQQVGERVEDLVTKAQMLAKGITSPDMADTHAMSHATQQPIRARADGTSFMDSIYVVPSDGFAGMHIGEQF